MALAPCQQLFYEFSGESIGYRRISKAPANVVATILIAPPGRVDSLDIVMSVPCVQLTLVAAVAAGLLQTAQAGRAYIQSSCQERKHPLGPMQELGAFACGPPVELLPTHSRCRLSEKAVTGVTLFRFDAPWPPCADW
jgi:hypothetical protein